MKNVKYFLNPKLSQTLRETINSFPFFNNSPLFRQKYNLICAGIDRIDTALNYLNEHKEYPKSENEFILFLVNGFYIRDTIFKFYKTFDIEYRHHDEKKYFLKAQEKCSHQINSNDFITDDKFIEYIRSITFAHPLDTNRYFKHYFEDQYSPYVLVNNPITVSLFGEVIGLKIYTGKYMEKDIVRFDIPFKDIKSYIYSRYRLVVQVTKYLQKIIEDFKKEYINKKVIECNEPIQLLNNMQSILKERFVDTYDIDEAKLFLSINLTNKDNESAVKLFREEILNEINTLKEAINNWDEEAINNGIPCLYSYPNNMHDKAGYQLEKIHSYLHGKRNKQLIPYSDEEWGLIQLYDFIQQFSHKWVTIDYKSMEYDEIQLLVSTSLYLETQKQNKKIK